MGGPLHKQGTLDQALMDMVVRCGIPVRSTVGRKLKQALRVLYEGLPRDSEVNLEITVTHQPHCLTWENPMQCTCDPDVQVANANQPELTH